MMKVEITVQVQAKNSDNFYYQCMGPNPTIPRVGEHIEFADGLGRVESVIWKPKIHQGMMLVIVECVQASMDDPQH
jgi:hypothetical protein